MCTWFYAERSTLSPIITKAQQLPLADTIRNTMSRSAEMSGNIRPTDMAAVFAPNKQGNMAVFPMIWGFTVEQSSKPLINCRIETADQKPVWKDSWFRRRCVIPASWYYEWGIPPSEVGYHNANEQRNIKKEKYAIQPEGAEITYLAGLYRFEEHRGVQIPMFAVITRESVEPVSSIHDRMPLILGKDSLREWVRPDGDPSKIAKKALTKMIMEKATDYPEPKPAFMQIKNRSLLMKPPKEKDYQADAERIDLNAINVFMKRFLWMDFELVWKNPYTLQLHGFIDEAANDEIIIIFSSVFMSCVPVSFTYEGSGTFISIANQEQAISINTAYNVTIGNTVFILSNTDKKGNMFIVAEQVEMEIPT